MSLDSVTKQEIVQCLNDVRAQDWIQLLKLLVAQVGKEKTKEILRKARWDAFYKVGREAAERLGHPRDLDSFVEEYFVKHMSTRPWVTLHWIERTKDRLVIRVTENCTGQAFAKWGDEEVREIAKEAFCIHDIAWAAGFNPDITIRINKIFYDGDDYCEFIIELKENS